MATGVSLPNVQVISESLAPVNGAIAGCGQAAVLMMNGIVRGQPVTANELLNLIKFSVATGHSVSKSGATTPSDLQWLAEQSGVKTHLGPGSSWRSTVDTAIPAGKPVVLGVSNARAFGGSDARVDGHYVTVVGTTTDGRYIVADPNQQAAKSGGTVIYSAQQIQDARPFATLTPTAAVTPTTSSGSGDCVHTINFGGLGGVGATSICLDPLLDGIIRGALIGVGVLLVIVAILIFTRQTWQPVVAGAAGASAQKAQQAAGMLAMA